MKHLLPIACLTLAIAFPHIAAAQGSERFPLLSPDQLTPAQKKWADDIGQPPRNAKITNPPYKVYVYSPEFAALATNLSGYLRWHTTLPPRLSEFAILIAARQWSSDYEWKAHYPLAVKGGLDPKIPAAMAVGKRPTGMKDDEEAMYNLCTELLGGKKVTDTTFNTAVAKFGRPAIVDVVGLMGYYGISAMATMVSDYETKPGDEPKLQPIK